MSELRERVVTTHRTELTIEHLVLEGVRPAEAHLVGQALERELARLLTERGAPNLQGTAETDVPVSIDTRAGESPAALGTRLAGAIFGRLNP